MTRKDYVLLTDTLRNIKTSFIDKNSGDPVYEGGKYDSWYVTVNRLAHNLHDINPKLDIQRFIKDCHEAPDKEQP